ncbi:iron-containing alcohol dehydrogenase [Desulfovibrio ferrophilus]|uniref:Iron-containing alcohol dehydrogenase n=1 Tax=Desulfovibrio ferrophilus TaxID=241368 RepID=A0A2Z6AUC2_9BACT|nr:iron-containing alcohol dehydrogenase [Desulfovibrio ferrophilus]BBD06831.1 iron-containing alcohol dehydrogenase [Desulfovibrio ferrophilus]
MQSFVYHNPTKIIFGLGVLGQTGAEAAAHGKRALLVTGGGSIRRSGVYDTVRASLEAAGIEVVDFGGVEPNPKLSHLRQGIELAKTSGADLVIAAGGGSVMDEAKAIAAGACMDTDINDYLTGGALLSCALPVITVPTVAATGSEMNGVFVITNDETHVKNGMAHDLVRPKTSIMDPATTATIPLEYTILAAVDIVSHATEGTLTQADNDTPLQDGLTDTVVRTVMDCMHVLMATPTDLPARTNMMWASTLAWNGLCPAGIGTWAKPCHMLGHPISAMYDTLHGATLSIVTPAWMEHQAEIEPTRIARWGRSLFGVSEQDDRSAALVTASALRGWYRKLGAPLTFAEAGIEKPDLDGLAERSMSIARSKGEDSGWNTAGIRSVLERSLQGSK